jgi:hypothetical protein
VLQYSLIKPFTAILTLSLFWSGHLRLGDYSLRSPLLWIAIIDNTSVSIALYYLVAFYYASKHNPSLQVPPVARARPFLDGPVSTHQMGRPLPKFIAVKSIVFFAFWQTLTIDILAACGIIASYASPARASSSPIDC